MNQSPGAGWEMLTEVLPSSMVLSNVLMWKDGCFKVLSGKLVPSGLMTGGAPYRKCLEEIMSRSGTGFQAGKGAGDRIPTL